ncbi:hypothetical protein F5Y12DRAFT_788639 [Xylaria sp. FL1777]|nr:hypothetical protein F5Y12DRAFT_788639 [Xylaria sp. FL1777]
MYRAALRSAPRLTQPLRQSHIAASGRRFASTTTPVDKKRSWKSSAARWGLAIGAVYWYSTSTVFAEEPKFKTIQPPPEFSDEDLPTVEAVVARKRLEAEARLQKTATSEPETAALASQTSPSAPAKEIEASGQAAPEGSPEALEEEAAQQGAFNPETGEINWDCPCLGGMAHGPCGEEFKAAFSCFVYSEEEPKGMNCIDKFQHMQDCFRLHPEVYGEELADDDEEAATAADGVATDGVSARDAPVEGASDVDATSMKSSSPKPTKIASPTEEVTEIDAKIGKPKPEREKVTPTSSPTPTKTILSYADVAASGPKQSPEEAAAPRPPQIIPSETASTSSLIDVDTPSVRTVPSDFLEQDVQTETQERRKEREEDAAAARAEADLAKKKKKKTAANQARKADNFLTKFFGELSDGASTALVATNLAAVVGVSAYLGYKALGLYERGRFTWKSLGVGAGVALGVGLFEAALGG